jgi:kynureninase
MGSNIAEQVSKLGSGPLTEEGLKEHIWPLFSRVIAADKLRNEIYLANHSLGRPMDQMEFDVREGLEAWYSLLDGAWGQQAWSGEIDRL